MKQTVIETIGTFFKSFEVFVIPIAAGVVKHLLYDDRHTFIGIIRDMLIAGFAGYLAHLILLDVSYLTEGQKSFIIGVSAFSGEIFLKGILELAKRFVKNPKDTIKSIKDNIWKK